MPVVWRNNGEKTDNGEYVVDLTDESGNPYQTYRAPTRKDMVEKLAGSNDEANNTIKTLKAQRVPIGRQELESVAPLSADDRFAASVEITDPERIDAALERVLSARLGMPLDEVKQELKESAELKQKNKVTQETLNFVAATPDWYPTDANKVLLFSTIMERKWAPIASNFGIVWDEMKENGKAELRPVEGEAEEEEEGMREEEVKPLTRPRLARTISTGIRNVDTSPRMTSAAPRSKWTQEMVDKMGVSEYKKNYLNDPSFRAFVDGMGQQTQQTA